MPKPCSIATNANRPPHALKALFAVLLCDNGKAHHGVFIDALPMAYDKKRWPRKFIAICPPGSPTCRSYFDHLVHGASYSTDNAFVANVRARHA